MSVSAPARHRPPARHRAEPRHRAPRAAVRTPTRRAGAPATYQPEIQGLRTIAVTLVVIYHLWPHVLRGGYVGVDVFFVISGYLITSHIHREIEATGTLKVRAFWARRIRRILPLSFVVLAFSLVGAAFILPSTAWDATVRQVGASALYVQNWVLAHDAVQYSALDDSATVVQHYWSLSLEEQFYLFWPLLLIAAIVATRYLGRVAGRENGVSARALITSALVVVAGVSFTWSVLATASSPARAYFVTPTRVWEFAAGALVATVFLGRQHRGPVGNLLGWCGLALIVGSAFAFSSTTAFPGWIALLPVAGAALVIQCGSPHGFGGVHHWLSTEPATAVGGVSYGIYLWHWPLIVLAPVALHTDLRWPLKLWIIAASLVLAFFSKTYVEDPTRRGVALRSLPRSFGFAVAGMATILVAGLALAPIATTGDAGGQVQIASIGSCYGPDALVAANHCASPVGDGNFTPSTLKAAREAKGAYIPGCQQDSAEWPPTCTAGVSAAAATTTVAIVGDSFATRWLPTLDAIAKEQRWHVRVFTRGLCTPSLAVAVSSDKDAQRRGTQCAQAMVKVDKAIATDPTISTVFVTGQQAEKNFQSPAGTTLATPSVDGITKIWNDWTAAGKTVVAIDEVPMTGGHGDIPTCVEQHRSNVMACATPRSDAFGNDRFVKTAATAAANPHVVELNFDNDFCDATMCYPVIGDVLVFMDTGHITYEYAMAMVPEWKAQLAKLHLLAA